LSSHFTKKAALSLDDSLHPASEGHAGLGDHGRVHGGKVLHNGGDQVGLGSVGISVSMCPQVAPHKIVQRIKIRTAGRPAVLRDQVVAVVLEPLDGPVGDMAGDRVLLPHPRTISCHCLDPGKDGALHKLQIDVRVDPEASLKDVRGLPNLPGGHQGSWCKGNNLPGVPGLCQSPFLAGSHPAVHTSQISNLAICQNVTFPCQNHDYGAPSFSLGPRNLCQGSRNL
jgi:hypothetical protein